MQLTCKDRVERAARIYASNKEASHALGVAAGSFGRSCLYGIETPHARRRRKRQKVRTGGPVDG